MLGKRFIKVHFQGQWQCFLENPRVKNGVELFKFQLLWQNCKDMKQCKIIAALSEKYSEILKQI